MINETNPYNLRNNSNYSTLPRRTEIYAKSVIPSSIKLWNELNHTIREAPTLSTFKNMLKQQFKPPIVPKFFLSGERIFSVYHA